MTYKVYDLETGVKSHLKRKASPFHPENYIVAAGWKNKGDSKNSWDYNPEYTKYNLKIEDDITLLVGFNLKFDLLWQWDNPDLIRFFKRGGRIWDCQYVEYLLNGQDPRFHYPSLNEVAPRYGGTEKIDEVKVLWDAGVDTPDINKDLLIDYLVGTEEEKRDSGDVGNTEKVFLGQVKKAKELGMIQAIWSRMDGLCATTEMEWNGLKIDVEEAKKQFKKLSAERNALGEELESYVPELPEGMEFKWTSRIHKSCLIFGGTAKYKKPDVYIDPKTNSLARKQETEKHYVTVDGDTVSPNEVTGEKSALNSPKGPVDYYKSGKKKGQPKTKNVKVPGEYKTKIQEFYFKFDGFTDPIPGTETKNTDGAGDPVYKTNADTIALLQNSGVPFCESLSRYEALEKEIGTYFLSRNKKGELSGMLTHVGQDHIIHHNLNHCATVTTRLSSDKPNLQNIPRSDKSDLKRVFVSRFEDGSMIEADYSQLEVVVQGVLSEDEHLLEDLRNRIDFHCKRVAIQPKYNITYDEVVDIIKNEEHPDHKLWKERRTNAKIFSFQRAYGAGAALIAAFTGMSVEEVEDLIAADEATYPGIVVFNERVEKEVKSKTESFYDPQNEGLFQRGYWQAPTGCLYHFRSWPAKDWQLDRGIEESFNPTEMKNYPIQGTGGEIVQGLCGKLWRHFVSNGNYDGKAFLCNTVHDCVWADTHPDVKEQVAKDIKRIMESVDEWFAEFGVKITVPFPVEVEVGPNMLDLKHVL